MYQYDIEEISNGWGKRSLNRGKKFVFVDRHRNDFIDDGLKWLCISRIWII